VGSGQVIIIRTSKTLSEIVVVFLKAVHQNHPARKEGSKNEPLKQHPHASPVIWVEIVKEQVVCEALKQTELSPRELACRITDTKEYFISESSVYRILKNHDLITSPAYILMQAGDSFKNPTRRVHELWQMDFTY